MYSKYVSCLSTISLIFLQKGKEEIMVMSLLLKACDHHQLRSAFTRGSVRGHVYLECTMNQELVRLLMNTPGVIRRRSGIRRKAIEKEEAIQMLIMQDVNADVVDGQWIRITKGLYKGDVGHVISTTSWGASILLVPRLAYRARAFRSLKRKASPSIPEPRLFDATAFRSAFPDTAVDLDESSTYRIGRLTIEWGLARLDFDFHSFSTGVDEIAHNSFEQFIQSQHPFILDSMPIPRPKEWIFSEFERVVILSTGEKGTVSCISSRFVDVSLDPPEDDPVYGPLVSIEDQSSDQMQLIRTTWNDVHKIFNVGDHVQINSGPNAKRTGWITEIQGNMATLIEKSGRDNNNPYSNSNAETQVGQVFLHHSHEY